MKATHDEFSWLTIPAEDAARRLLGCELISTINGESARVQIVEVEAYDQDDEASHTFRGMSARNAAMFKPAGHMYVYLSYGIHYCCNVVCGKEGFGSGVLIRAVEPLEGTDVIERRRHVSGHNATNGPGKVAQALGIDLSLTGHLLTEPPVRLVKRPELPTNLVISSRRVGISKAVHELRRFYIKGNPYISRK